MIQSLKETVAREEANRFFMRMKAFGFTKEEAIALIKKTAEEEKA